MIHLAVLDMAGTTVTDNSFVATAFQTAFRQHNLEVSDAEVNPLMGYPKPVAIRMVLENRGVKHEQGLVDSISDAFTRAMLDFYEDSPHVQPMPGAEDLFLYLQERGIYVALNTGFSREIAQVIIDRFQWLDRGLVDDFIASDEVEQGRPHADMIIALKERFSLGDESVVMKVGDTLVDIEEGKAARCKYVIAVTTGATPEEELAAYKPTHIISSLSQIPSVLKESIEANV